MTRDVLLQVVYNPHCNARCTQCTFWRGFSPTPRTGGDLQAIIEEFSELEPGATVNVGAGAEALTFPLDTFDIARYARGCGLKTLLITNGLLVRKHLADIARTFDKVTVSVDSASPVTHDAYRGVPGLWKRAMVAIESLAERKVQVSVQMILRKATFREVPLLRKLARARGATHLDLSPIQPAFGGGSPRFTYQDELIRGSNLDELCAILGCFEDYTPAIPAFRAFFADVEHATGWGDFFVKGPRCSAHTRGLTVMPDGTLAHCQSPRSYIPKLKWERYGDVRKFYEGRAEDRAFVSRMCLAGCSVAACNRDVSTCIGGTDNA